MAKRSSVLHLVGETTKRREPCNAQREEVIGLPGSKVAVFFRWWQYAWNPLGESPVHQVSQLDELGGRRHQFRIEVHEVRSRCQVKLVLARTVVGEIDPGPESS
jgi:hypothetical protein